MTVKQYQVKMPLRECLVYMYKDLNKKRRMKREWLEYESLKWNFFHTFHSDIRVLRVLAKQEQSKHG